jgi:parallel beta-helix repeat protein
VRRPRLTGSAEWLSGSETFAPIVFRRFSSDLWVVCGRAFRDPVSVGRKIGTLVFGGACRYRYGMVVYRWGVKVGGVALRFCLIGQVALCAAAVWMPAPSLAATVTITDPADTRGALDLRMSRLIDSGDDLRLSLTMSRPFRVGHLRARAGAYTRTVCFKVGPSRHPLRAARFCLTRHGSGGRALYRSPGQGAGSSRGFVAAKISRPSRVTVDVTVAHSAVGIKTGARVAFMVTSVWRGVGACALAEPCRDQAPNSGLLMPALCKGLPVGPGQDLATVVSAAAPGTTFCIADGNYTLGTTIQPKSDDRFVGVYADGTPPNISNVGSGPVFSGGQHTYYQGLGIGPSNGIGLSPGSGSTVIGDYIHDNEVSGIETVANHLTIKGNEVGPDNGTDAYAGTDASGIKLHGYLGAESGAYNLVVGNTVHDNLGYGLWSDCDSHDNLFEGNYVYDNAGVGLDDETSYNNTWSKNDVRDNGFAWAVPAVSIRDTFGSRLVGNVFTRNRAGVLVAMDERATLFSPSPGLGCADRTLTGYLPSETVISDNRFIATGPSGFEYQGAPAPAFAANCWSVPSLAGTYWQLPGNPTASWEDWQAAGLDVYGREQTTRC